MKTRALKRNYSQREAGSVENLYQSPVLDDELFEQCFSHPVEEVYGK